MGLPLVTTFDPDGLVESEGLGAAANSVQSVSEQIDRLLNKDPNERISRRPDVAFVEPELHVSVADDSDLDNSPTLRGLPLVTVDA